MLPNTDGSGPVAERSAIEELLRSVRWTAGAVNRNRVMSGHSRRLTLTGPHFAYLSAGALTLRVTTGDEAETADLRLRRGDFLLLPHGAELQAQAPTGTGADVVTGALRPEGDALPQLTTVMPATVFGCTGSAVDSALLDLVDAELRSARPGDSAVLNRLVDLIVSAALRSWLENGCASAAEWLVQLRDPRLQRVLAAIHAEPGQPWTVATLARVANTSRSQFAEVFRGAIGDTPARYLTRVRMRRAEEQLLSGRTVGQVAFDLGYVSDEGFRRAFQRHTGSAPTSWLRDARSTTAMPTTDTPTGSVAPGSLTPVWHVATA